MTQGQIKDRGLPLAALLAFLAVCMGCGKSPSELPFRLTGVVQKSEYAVVYCIPDAATAPLPLRLTSETVVAIRKDGQQTAMAGCADVPIVPRMGLLVRKGDGDKDLNNEILPTGPEVELLLVLERKPSPGEIALVFKASADDLLSVEIKEEGNHKLVIPLR